MQETRERPTYGGNNPIDRYEGVPGVAELMTPPRASFVAGPL
jgi:hypothetical protein